MGQLYAVAFPSPACSPISFDVSYLSYLPTLVNRDQLVEGNAKLAASSSVAEVGGFSLSGWLVQVVTGPVTLLIDAVSFLFSAAFIAAIRAPEPAPAAAESVPASARTSCGGGLLHDASGDRVSAAAVGDQPAVVVAPLTDVGFGRSWITFTTEKGFVILEARDLPLDQTTEIAEGIKCEGC